MRTFLATASWCGPCHQLKNKLRDSKIEVEILEFDDNTELFRELGIKTVPTLVIQGDDGAVEKISSSEDILNHFKNANA